MKRLVILILLFISIVSPGKSEPLGADTTHVLNHQFRDAQSIRKLIDTTFKYKETNLSYSLKWAEFAYNRALQLKNIELQAGALNVEGTIYGAKRQHDKALYAYFKALKLFESIKHIKRSIVLNNIGLEYNSLNKPKQALSYLSQGEKLSLSTKNQHALALIYSNYMNTYIQLGDLKQALDYGLKSVALVEKYKLPISNSAAYNNIGALYFFQSNYSDALKNFKIAKDLGLKARNLIDAQRANYNIGEVYEITHEGDALKHYMEALTYSESIKENDLIYEISTSVYNHYLKLNQFEKALLFYKKAVKAREIQTSTQTQKEISAIQTQYETEKKQQKIYSLNNQNTIKSLSIARQRTTIGIISSLLVFSLGFAIVLHNRNKLKHKALYQEQIIKQQEVLTKAVVEAEENERLRIGSDLHDGVGQLFSTVKLNLSGLLERVKVEREEDRFLAEKTLALVDESCKEVRYISHQMMPNMLLKSGIASDVKSFIEKIDSEALKINFEATGFKNKLEDNVETVLYRIIQESVNNVIKHSKATELDIKLIKNKGAILATIRDNGIGFNVVERHNFEGIGLKNIATRIEYLKGSISYESSVGQGTTINIMVPLS